MINEALLANCVIVSDWIRESTNNYYEVMCHYYIKFNSDKYKLRPLVYYEKGKLPNGYSLDEVSQETKEVMIDRCKRKLRWLLLSDLKNGIINYDGGIKVSKVIIWTGVDPMTDLKNWKELFKSEEE